MTIPFRLDCTARYIPSADAIVGIIYVQDSTDPTAPKFIPNRIGGPTCQARLINNADGTHIQVLDLDRRMGNSDGSIRVIFNHPAQTKNLSFEVVLYVLDANPAIVLERIAPVTLDVVNNPASPIPLGQQPDNPPDIQSRARLNEILVDG